jgi:2-methylcitrate dehydratase
VDKTTQKLVAYTRDFSPAELTEPVMVAAVNHLFDAMAVAITGSGSEPARIATRIARTVHSDSGATILGYGVKTSPELAAFANAIMVRTHDYNDGMAARGGGHPSDMISGVLAIGEITHASGLDVLVAMTLAYELLGGLGYEVDLGDNGFDQGTFMGVATALAAGKLLGLNEAQLGNAASLALVPNIPLSAGRWGTLSMMKGCATAYAVRNAIFATLLAKEGMTSAPDAFEGIHGLWESITGPFDPRLPVMDGDLRVVQMSHMKPMPAETNALGILGLVPRIREWTAVDAIESIEMDLPERLAKHLGDEPKFDPKNRETADHSLPYMLAVALTDGQITLASYSPERIADPALRPLMRTMSVRGDPAFTKARLEGNVGVARPTPARILIRTRGGEEFQAELMGHKGHMTDPMTRADINAKLDTICAGVIDDERRERIRSAWWNVADASDIGQPIQTLGSFRDVGELDRDMHAN